MIQIKNAKELDGMRKANALSAAALKYGGEHIEAFLEFTSSNKGKE